MLDGVRAKKGFVITNAAVDQEVACVLCAGNVVGHHFVDELLDRGYCERNDCRRRYGCRLAGCLFVRLCLFIVVCWLLVSFRQ